MNNTDRELITITLILTIFIFAVSLGLSLQITAAKREIQRTIIEAVKILAAGK